MWYKYSEWTKYKLLNIASRKAYSKKSCLIPPCLSMSEQWENSTGKLVTEIKEIKINKYKERKWIK